MQILQLSSTVSRLRSPRTCTKHGEKNRYHFLFFVVFPFISTFMMGFCNSFLPFIDTIKAFTPCTHKPNANVSIMAFSENLSVRDLLRASIRLVLLMGERVALRDRRSRLIDITICFIHTPTVQLHHRQLYYRVVAISIRISSCTQMGWRSTRCTGKLTFTTNPVHTGYTYAKSKSLMRDNFQRSTDFSLFPVD